MPRVSPVVTLWWRGKVIRLLRAVAPQIGVRGDLPESACASFVHACYDLPETRKYPVEIHSLQYPPEWHLCADGCADRFAWYRKLLADLRSRQPAPVLWNMDPPYDVLQGGIQLWQWLPRESSPQRHSAQAERDAAPDRGGTARKPGSSSPRGRGR
jgi:hypothetical protein